MTNHKFTDEEIIKALECSVEHNERKNASCDGCPLEKVFPYCNRECSEDTLDVMYLALINRQKAEIESLNAIHADMTESLRLAAEANKDMSVELDAMRGAANSYKMHYEEMQAELGDLRTIVFTDRSEAIEAGRKKLKAEAIKEFAERLKANMSNIARMEYGGHIYFCVGYDLIDTLVKEMTEENNG